MKIVKIPNLPDGNVSCVLLDARAPKKLIDELKNRNIEIIPVFEHPDVYSAVSCHPDIMFHHISGNIIVYAPNTPLKIMEFLCKKGFEMIKGETFLQNKYPGTIAYNVARVGSFAFHNTKYTDPIIKKLLEEQEIRLIHVKQGYSKCLTCVVDSKSIITSDREIYRKAAGVGLDVLLIEPDKSIKLEPFDMGFIGGATGLISKNKLLFTGDITLHKNYKEINDFLSLKAVDMVIIKDEHLTDLGTIIPVTQE
ncbi:DUF6873 family GME fold protein [Clostridium sp. BNL1100]|uniref:DUF6873 family GME fold protein n=1 Tax=Clostridium sp. BNL1100 TaxID=755731 RepID=UPI00024A7E8B|nr:hypothetical protein [Clostridium sp. BNL1100]AEY68041.1 hypothetical protein Clo1100_3930 [Clostridium sp. BNL1100]